MHIYSAVYKMILTNICPRLGTCLSSWTLVSKTMMIGILRIMTYAGCTAESPDQIFRRSVSRDISSQHANNAITMYSVCSDYGKPHRGTLYHDKGQSVTKCDVRSWAAKGTNRHTTLSFSANTIIHAHIKISPTYDTFLPTWLLSVPYINCTVRTITRMRHHASPPMGLPGLPSSSATLGTRYIVKLLAPLPRAPVLDCNRRRNYHMGTWSYTDRLRA